MKSLAGALQWGKRAGFDPRALAAPVAVALGYYLANRLGFVFRLEPYPISVLWPANALLLSSLLLLAPRRWWLVIAFTLPAHLLVQLGRDLPLAMVLGWFVSNWSEALIGAGLVRLFIPWPQRLRLDSFHNAGVVLLLACVAAPFVSSFLDAALVRLIGVGEVGYLQLVQLRFFSNLLAELVIVPLVLTFAALEPQRLREAPPERHAEAAAVLGGVILTSLAVFAMAHFDPSHAPALYYAPLPFLLWSAVRLGPAGTSVAIAAMALITIRGAVHGEGPFAGGAPEQIARTLQIFLIAVSVPLLLLSVVLEERARSGRELRAQREQLTHLSRVAMLSDMSGGLAHELNQPLTAILSNAQAAQHLLANRKVDEAELGDILRDIISADQRAGDVIRRLRALFRRGETAFERLDPHELVREVMTVAHGDLVTRGVETAFELEAGLPAVEGDRVQLQQVMLNLVMNAADAMASRPERLLKVQTRADGQGVRLSFIDSGPGFSADMAEKLFEPFYTTKPQGLGLGLSISRSIVTAHGGQLWGRSSGRAGAAFHIVLPAAGQRTQHAG